MVPESTIPILTAGLVPATIGSFRSNGSLEFLLVFTAIPDTTNEGLIMFKHLLIPTDGSESSARAIAKGAALAKALGARLTLMTAVVPASDVLAGAAYKAADNPMNEAARTAAQYWLDSALVMATQAGVLAEQLMMQERSVYESILAAARQQEADLIVMGSHGAGALERLLLGSQTQRVLAHTNLPVLVLR